MNARNMGSVKQNARKKAPSPDLYTASEAAQSLGIPASTFQNYVRQGKIDRVVPSGKKEGFYRKQDVEQLGRDLRANPHKRRRQQNQTVPAKTVQPQHKADEEATTDWIRYEDELNAYKLDCELYGFENSVSPDITWTWWQKNPYACRILYNRHNRNELWGLLSIIPMEEDTIFKLLNEEMSEKDIRPEHVLVYEPGKHYSCYVAAISMRSDHRHSFSKLLRSVMEYWCEHPDIYIDRLFAFALGGEKSSGMRLIRRMFFWPRRDIAQNAWELDLRVFNPNPAIEEFRTCIDDIRTRKYVTKPTALSLRTLEAIAGPDTRPVPVSLRRASEADVPIIMQISAATYGSSGTPLERRIEWLRKNPEYLYVARQDGERIIGYASIMPLKRNHIEQILSEEIHPGEITADELEAFESNQVIDLYIASVAVLPGLSEEIGTKAGFELIKHLMDVFVELGDRGIKIGRIYARSRTPDGIKTLIRMGFTEIASTAQSAQRHFMIDVELSGVHFIKQYKKALQYSQEQKDK